MSHCVASLQELCFTIYEYLICPNTENKDLGNTIVNYDEKKQNCHFINAHLHQC